MKNFLHASHPEQALPPLHQADVRERLLLRFATGKSLFRAGDERQVYRIESGAVCHFADVGEGRCSGIEFAFAGDIIGLGHLPTHSSTAVAMVDTSVVLVTSEEVDLAVLSNDRLSYALADAAERDFAYLRAKTIDEVPLAPVRRLANYLLAVLGVTRGERGIGELVLLDEINSSFVAEQLQMSVDTLALALLSLKRSGVVDVSKQCTRVLDVSRLEMLANAA